MKVLSSNINSPSQYEIELWYTQKNLDEFPILGTSPLSPLSSMMIQYPDSVSDIIGGKNFDNINQINKNISQIEKSVYYLYQFRSHTIGLEDEIASKNLNFEQYSSDLGQMIQNYKNTFDNLIQSSNSVIETLVNIFSQESIWNTEQYFAELIDSLFFLIFRLFTFINLWSSQKDIKNDITVFSRLFDQNENENLSFLKSLSQRFDSCNSFKDQIYQLLNEKSIQLPQIQNIFNIFRRHIKSNQNLMHADDFTSQVVSLLFLIDLQEHFSQSTPQIPDDAFQFLHSYRQKHPSIVLLYDFSMNYEEFIGSSIFSGDQSSRSSGFSFTGMFKKIFTPNHEETKQQKEDQFYQNEVLTKSYYVLFLKHLERLKNREQPTSDQISELYKFIINILIQSNQAIRCINELMISQRNKNQGFEEIDEPIKNEICCILKICQKYRKLLVDNYKTIYSLLSGYVSSTVYNFISTVFKEFRTNSPAAFERNKSELEFIEKLNQINEWSSSIQIYLISVLRCSLQLCTQNEPKSTGLFSKSTGFSAADKEAIQNFLKSSQHFIAILKLDDEIQKVFDLSSLYFNEFASFSLPDSLSKYSIECAESKNELNKHIFDYFSIYNSAAYTAVKILQSKRLYNEIKQESLIVLNYLVEKLSKIAFDSIQKVTTDRYIQNNTKCESKLDQKTIQFVSNIRLLLQQDRFELVDQNLNLKDNFSIHFRKHFIEKLLFLVDAIEQYGLCVIYVFSTMVEIYRNMHTFLIELGLPLPPFNDLLQEVIQSGSPKSFKSKLFEIAYSNLFNSVLPEYSFYSCPYRFFPTKEIKGLAEFIENNKKVIPFECFTSTLMFITVNHFRELFKFLDTGCMVIIINNLRTTIADLFKKFFDCYSKVKKIIYRIQDKPLQLGCFNLFSEFDCRYRTLLVEDDVLSLFSYLKQIGNAIAIVEMLDDTFSLKKSSEQQFMAYLFSCKPVDETNESVGQRQLDEAWDDIFELNKQFEDSKRMYQWEDIEDEVIEEKESDKSVSNNDGSDSAPSSNQPYLYANFALTSASSSQPSKKKKLVVAPKKELILQPFKSLIVSDIYKIIKSENIWSMFAEESVNVLDFMSLTGYAAKWSVLEFLFCLIEAERTDKGSVFLYGDGTCVASSLILSILKQVPMAQAFSICEKIEVLYNMENDLPKEIITKFIDAYNYVKALSKSSLATFDPILVSISTA